MTEAYISFAGPSARDFHPIGSVDTHGNPLPGVSNVRIFHEGSEEFGPVVIEEQHKHPDAISPSTILGRVLPGKTLEVTSVNGDRYRIEHTPFIAVPEVTSPLLPEESHLHSVPSPIQTQPGELIAG